MWKDRLQLQKVSLFVAALLIFTVPGLTFGADFKTFTSDEYGFSMKFPPTWIKIDKPQGNYYVVFQDPDLTENFRAKIHVAAHKPVKDQLNVFLQELRNGITDLQKGTGTAKEKQEVRILDEGEFKSEVPGAYYFFIQAFENIIQIEISIKPFHDSAVIILIWFPIITLHAINSLKGDSLGWHHFYPESTQRVIIPECPFLVGSQHHTITELFIKVTGCNIDKIILIIDIPVRYADPVVLNVIPRKRWKIGLKTHAGSKIAKGIINLRKGIHPD